MVFVQQDALAKWCGKIDAADAILLALLRSLSPDNPAVAAHMWKGHFLFSRTFINDMLPLLDISGDRIGRRLKKLSEIGLIDLQRKLTGAGKRLYARLSRLYWAEEERANRKAGNHAVKTPHGENAIGCSGPNHAVRTPQDHLNDQEETEPNTPPASSPPERLLQAATPEDAEIRKEQKTGSAQAARQDGYAGAELPAKRDSLGPVPTGPTADRLPEVGKGLASWILEKGDPDSIAKVRKRNSDLVAAQDAAPASDAAALSPWDTKEHAKEATQASASGQEAELTPDLPAERALQSDLLPFEEAVR